MSSVGTVTVLKRNGKGDGAMLEWSSEKSGLLIGRHEDCDIRVQLPTVSRKHASLQLDPKTHRVYIIDLSAVNVTQLNNQPAPAGRNLIKHKDVITCGDRSFRFEYAGGKTPVFVDDGKGYSSDEEVGENMAPGVRDESLKGDATQDLSRFVRVTVPKSSSSSSSSSAAAKQREAPKLATVNEANSPAVKAAGGGNSEDNEENDSSAPPQAPVAAPPAATTTTPAASSPAVKPSSSPAKAKKQTLNTPLKKSIANHSSTSASTHISAAPKLNTPMKKYIHNFNHSNLKSRSIGSAIAVLDSFKDTVVMKALPSPIRRAISEKRRNNVFNKPLVKVLSTPLRKDLKNKGDKMTKKNAENAADAKSLPSQLIKSIVKKGSAANKVFVPPAKGGLDTPVKRAITALRKREGMGLKKVVIKSASASPADVAVAVAAKSPVAGTPNNNAAFDAAAIALPKSVIKSAVKPASMSTPLKRSIQNCRTSFASSKKKVGTPAPPSSPKSSKGKSKSLPPSLIAAIKARAASDLTVTVSKSSIENFISDRLLVESYARELKANLEVDEPIAVECALDAYMSTVAQGYDTSDDSALLTIGKTDRNEEENAPFKALPVELRKSIAEWNSAHATAAAAAAAAIAAVSTPKMKGSTPSSNNDIIGSVPKAQPNSPFFGSTDFNIDADTDANIEEMFEDRPEDVELIESYAKDFEVKAGLDQATSYGYALDSYLEGVTGFWNAAESVAGAGAGEGEGEGEDSDEEDADVESDEEDGEDDGEGMMNIDSSDDEDDNELDQKKKQKQLVIDRRKSLAADMAHSLCELFNVDNNNNQGQSSSFSSSSSAPRADVTSSIAQTLCKLLTNTALESVKATNDRRDSIAADMGASLSSLFQSTDTNTEEDDFKHRKSIATNMAKSLSDLFELKASSSSSEVETTKAVDSPKSAVKEAKKVKALMDKRLSIAADMAESLCGLFKSPSLSVYNGNGNGNTSGNGNVKSSRKKKDKATAQLSLAQDMGNTLNLLFEDTAEAQIEQFGNCLETLFSVADMDSAKSSSSSSSSSSSTNLAFASDDVAHSLVDLLTTTAKVLKEDESNLLTKTEKKRKLKAKHMVRRRTSMRRISLTADVGSSLNALFKVGVVQTQTVVVKKSIHDVIQHKRYSLPDDMGDCMDSLFSVSSEEAAERELNLTVEFLNDVESVAGEVGRVEEGGDRSRALGASIDALLEGVEGEEEEEEVETETEEDVKEDEVEEMDVEEEEEAQGEGEGMDVEVKVKAATPKAATPKAATPKVATPKVATPKVTTPKVATPKVDTPVAKAATPKTATPKASTPKVDTPKVDTAKAGTPKVKTPKAATPKADTPKIDTPKTATPKAATPKVPTPKAATPKAATPEVDTPKVEKAATPKAKAATPKASTPKAATPKAAKAATPKAAKAAEKIATPAAPAEAEEEEEAEEEQEEEKEVDFTSLKVAELRTECEKRGLETKGVKAVLVKRLEEFVSCAGSGSSSSVGGVKENEDEGGENDMDVDDTASADDSSTDAVIGFTALKVAELRTECEKRNIDSKGVKAALVKRLDEFVKNGGEQVQAVASPKKRNADESSSSSSSVKGSSAKKAKVEINPDVNAAADGEVEVVDFTKLLSKELKSECEKRGLDATGTKAVLIKRLQTAASAVDGGVDEESVEEGEEEESGAAVKVDFASFKVAELREECEKRGLETKGVKAVLVKRLEAA